MKVSWGFSVSYGFVLTFSPFNTSEVSRKNPLFQETSYLIRIIHSQFHLESKSKFIILGLQDVNQIHCSLQSKSLKSFPTPKPTYLSPIPHQEHQLLALALGEALKWRRVELAESERLREGGTQHPVQWALTLQALGSLCN